MNIISTGVKRNMRGQYHSKTTLTSIPNKSKNVEITTSKNSRGEIVTHFQEGTLKQGEGYQTFSFIMFQDAFGILATQKRKATSDAIGTQHNISVHKYITEVLKLQVD